MTFITKKKKKHLQQARTVTSYLHYANSRFANYKLVLYHLVPFWHISLSRLLDIYTHKPPAFHSAPLQTQQRTGQYICA